VRVDEARDGGLAAPVEDRLAREGPLAEVPHEVGVRSREDDDAALEAQHRVRHAPDRALRGAAAGCGPFRRRELREVPDRQDGGQPASPSFSFRFGRWTEIDASISSSSLSNFRTCWKRSSIP